MSDPTWQDVAEVVMNSWPAGPGSKGWERDQLGGFVTELQERNLTPHWAIKGLRASQSSFIPSAGEVQKLARAAMPPLTAGDIQDIADRQARERRGITKLIEPGPPGEEMCCSVCGEWSPSADFDQVSDDELECPECGYANGPGELAIAMRRKQPPTGGAK